LSDRPPDFAHPFVAMAERIGKNDPVEFGGAFVIVPPSGDAVEVLHLDGKRDAGVFWSTLSARIAVLVGEIKREMDAQSRNPWTAR
jgi:hypothetical protein